MTKSMDAAQLGNFSPFNALESANLVDLLDSIEILQAKLKVSGFFNATMWLSSPWPRTHISGWSEPCAT